ncbi:hypothetical protein [Streptomyces sp. NPDC006463]|uniref:hypothetical protein n=1 Tax=Streptomyces sp. NPDC006463 TaxID=3364746 RepID=UPI0036ABA38F
MSSDFLGGIVTSLPQFTELDRLTSDEVEALRDLFCACADLRHELRSADALGHRVYQSLNNTERYTEGQRFTRHSGALLTLEQVTVDYQIAVENLALMGLGESPHPTLGGGTDLLTEIPHRPHR